MLLKNRKKQTWQYLRCGNCVIHSWHSCETVDDVPFLPSYSIDSNSSKCLLTVLDAWRSKSWNKKYLSTPSLPIYELLHCMRIGGKPSAITSIGQRWTFKNYYGSRINFLCKCFQVLTVMFILRPLKQIVLQNGAFVVLFTVGQTITLYQLRTQTKLD